MKILTVVVLVVMLSTSVFAVAPVNDYVYAQLEGDDEIDFWVGVIDVSFCMFFGIWGLKQQTQYGNWCGVLFTIKGVAGIINTLEILIKK